MRPIEINLAADPYRNDLPVAALLATLALAAFGLTAWESFAYFSAGAERAALTSELQGHRERMAAMKTKADRITADLAKVDQKQLRSQADFVAGILAMRNFSWTRLFNTLETVVPWSTRLTGIHPVFAKGRLDLDIEGVSRDMDAFLAFQSALLASDHFANLVPGDYQRMEGDERISFRLRTAYRPDPAAETTGPATTTETPPPAKPAPPTPATPQEAM